MSFAKNNDPFGFAAAINWDVVDEHAEEIAEIFDRAETRGTITGRLTHEEPFLEEETEIAALREQEEWEDDPDYRALYGMTDRLDNEI